jgi:hypothetical protein
MSVAQRQNENGNVSVKSVIRSVPPPANRQGFASSVLYGEHRAPLFCLLGVLFLTSCSGGIGRNGEAEDPGEEAWTDLFDGETLAGWTAKLQGHPVGDNYANTFRAEDGLIKVRYDGYDEFGDRFDEGFIALQAEGQEIDFRAVRLLNLKGCMDPEALSYKRYFVASDSATCRY